MSTAVAIRAGGALRIGRGAVALAAIVLLLLAGCSTALPTGTCNSAADCGAGEACLDGLCQPITAVCTGDAECPDGQRCDTTAGRCVALDGCATDEDCAGLDVCEDGHCVPIGAPECTADAECDPPDAICQGGRCVDGCVASGCTGAAECNPSTGRCVPTGGCDTDDDCNPPSTICEAGECRAGCPTRSCPLETVCVTDTGRCEAGCAQDAHCGPPDRVCDGTECVDGCGVLGCPEGYSCSLATGRCTPDDGCTVDSDCGPPDLVCEGGDCVAGCPTTGCGFEEHCDDATGRCAAGCAADGDCNPPDTVCVGGACVPPDCLADGCEGDLLCAPATGLCEAPGTLPLGASCEVDDDPVHAVCASDYCFPANDPFCSLPCTSTAGDCTLAGHACIPVQSPGGAYICSDVDAGTEPPGGSCAVGCKSGWCLGGETCTDVCHHDRDCATVPNTVCRIAVGVFSDGGDEQMVTVCAGPAAGTGQSGDTCQANADCRQGLCIEDRCADACHTSFDCPSGYACAIIDGPNDTAARACRPRATATATAPAGSACDLASHQPCRSGFCVDYPDDNPVGPYCLDTCGGHDDCPVGFRCDIVLTDRDDGGTASAPFCIPR